MGSGVKKWVHPGKLTWNPKTAGLWMFLLFQWCLFRFHVGFGGLYLHISANSWFHLQEWRPGKSYEPIFETIMASSSVSSLGGDLLTIDPWPLTHFTQHEIEICFVLYSCEVWLSGESSQHVHLLHRLRRLHSEWERAWDLLILLQERHFNEGWL